MGQLYACRHTLRRLCLCQQPPLPSPCLSLAPIPCALLTAASQPQSRPISPTAEQHPSPYLRTPPHLSPYLPGAGGKPPTLPSLCHPWSSGVTAWLSYSVLGITPIDPGYSRVRIAPHVSVAYPAVNGTVWVGAGLGTRQEGAGLGTRQEGAGLGTRQEAPLGGSHQAAQRAGELALAAKLLSPRRDPSIHLAASSPVAVVLCVPMSLPLATARSDSAAPPPAASALLNLSIDGREIAISGESRGRGGRSAPGKVAGDAAGGGAEFVVVQPRHGDGRLLACSRSLQPGAHVLRARYERWEHAEAPWTARSDQGRSRRMTKPRSPAPSTAAHSAGVGRGDSPMTPGIRPPSVFAFPHAHYAYTWSLDRR